MPPEPEKTPANPSLRVQPGNDERQDLSTILKHLNRNSPAGRTSIANHPATIAFLEAAITLTDELFSAPTVSKDRYIERPTLSYLSKPKVVRRAIQDYDGDPADRPTEPKFRDRWNSHSDFLADFTAYALIGRHWSLHLALSERALTLLTDEKREFARSVHAVALEDLELVLDLPAYRFQLLAAASAQADSVSAEALSRMYRTLSDAWVSLYRQVFERYGVTFRPGLTIDTFNIILQAAAEGLGLRLLADTNEALISRKRKTSILGTTALALLIAFIDPGDHLSLEEVANQYIKASTPSS